MSIKAGNQQKELENEIHSVDKNPHIDTSLLYEELRKEFKKCGKPIEVNFRSIVNWVKLGDKQTHFIHSYPAKLLPHIAHFFTNASILSKADSVVLDPFCGSGTVALEASMSNRIAFSSDSNPLARLITKVKTTPYNVHDLRIQTNEIVIKAKRFKKAPTIEIVNWELWYSPKIKEKLEILKRAIDEISTIETQDFFHLCFSALSRKLSYADPTISVPVKLRKKECFSAQTNKKIQEHLALIENSDPISDFYKICQQNIFRVEDTNLLNPNRKSCQLVGLDARDLKLPGQTDTSLPNNSVDLVITSPPYGSAQKYIRSTSLSLNWLCLSSVKNLRNLEYVSIGSESIRLNRVPIKRNLPSEFEDFITKISTINLSRSLITRTYLSELRDALEEVARVTKSKGHVVIVVGNNQVCGHILENDKFIISILGSSSFSLELSAIDNIKSRGLITKRNKTASVITHEHILVFKKK